MGPVPVPRPTTAFALGLASGILIVVSSLLLLLLFLPVPFGLPALVFGTIVLFSSILIYARPKEHAAWGTIMIVAASLSVIGLGGFVVGMILGIIGGGLGITWRPEGPVPYGYGPSAAYAGYAGAIMGPYGVPVTPWRLCMGCGRWIPWSYNICPLCGTQTPAIVGPGAAQQPTEPATRTPPPFPLPSSQSPTMPAPLTGQRAVETPFGPPQLKAPCPTCAGEAEWNASARKWYCPSERRYF